MILRKYRRSRWMSAVLLLAAYAAALSINLEIFIFGTAAGARNLLATLLYLTAWALFLRFPVRRTKSAFAFPLIFFIWGLTLLTGVLYLTPWGRTGMRLAPLLGALFTPLMGICFAGVSYDVCVGSVAVLAAVFFGCGVVKIAFASRRGRDKPRES